MKVQKLFTIDEDIGFLLKAESNASKLVNDLLKNYFCSGRHLESEEIRQKMSQISSEISEKQKVFANLQENLTQIEEKIAESRAIFREIPPEILDDFQFFPKMTEEILQKRFQNIYSKHKNLKYEQVLTAYKHYFKKK